MNAFANDKYADYLGLEKLSAADGRASARLEILPHHLNGAGIVHGGAIYSLAVWALALAANSADIGSDICVGIGGTITYVSNISGGTLYAYAEPLHLGGRILTYNVNVRDGEDKLIAVFQGNGFRRKNVQ